MEAEIASLAAAGASAIMGAMATDAWEVVKEGVARILTGRKPQAFNAVLAELEQSRRKLMSSDAKDQISSDYQGEWRSQLELLLAANPHAKAELQSLLDKVTASNFDTSGADVNLTANARDFGRIYQQGSGFQING